MKKTIVFAACLILTVLQCSAAPAWRKSLGSAAKSRFGTDGLASQRLDELDVALSRHVEATSEWLDHAERLASSESDLTAQSAFKCSLADRYRNRGALSKSIAHLTEVWTAMRNSSVELNQTIGDYALAQLAYSLSCVGRVRDLEQLFQETRGRVFKNQADHQVYNQAKEAFFIMKSHPGIAFRCGTAALYEVGKRLGGDDAVLRALDYKDSPRGGFSLRDLEEISEELELNLVPIRLRSHSAIPVPSVVHWKSDHFAAIKAKEGDLFEIVDHTLGLHLYMSQDEILAEGTGNFLVAEAAIGLGVRLLQTDSKGIIGRGYPNLMKDAKDFGCNNAASSGCQDCRGMPSWFVSEPFINLWVQDVPIFYKTSDGEVEFRLTFQQRDAKTVAWPATLTPAHWVHNWIGFVKFKAKANSFWNGYTAEVYPPGGGTLFFEDTKRFDPESGYFFSPIFPTPGASGHINLNTVGFGFKLRSPNGEVFQFGNPGDVVWEASNDNTGEALLTHIIDQKGRTNRFEYEFSAQGTSMRLAYMVDYDGRTNSLFYTNVATVNDRLWRVESPYGAVATLNYDSNGRLTSITDAVGLKSTIAYNQSSGALTNLITPYGTNFFEYYEDATGNVNSTNNAGGHELVNRALRVTDANGGRHLYMFRYDSTNLVQTSFPSSQIPQDQVDASLPSGTLLDTGGTSYNNLTFRNSFYWNAKTEPGLSMNNLSTLSSTDYSKSRWRHWLIENDTVIVTTSSALSFERMGAASSTVSGGVVWFDYPLKPAREKVGVQHKPSLIAARLENGETTFRAFTYTDQGFPATIESTYRPSSGADVTTSTASFAYTLDLGNEKTYWKHADPPVTDLQTTVVYTNVLLQSITIDGSQMLGVSGFESYTNSFEYYIPPATEFDVAEWYLITNVAQFPQPLYLSNALGETNQFFYGIKRRMEGILTPISLREFEYFTNGTHVGKLRRIDDNNASATELTYASNGTVASVQTPLNLTLTTSFDHLYRPLQIDFPAQAGSHAASSMIFSYTPASGTNVTGSTNLLDVTKITDRQGNEIKFEYTPGRAVKKLTDQENRVTHYLYSCSCGSLDAISNSLQVVSFDYDWQSRMTGVTYPGGTRVQHDYDTFGRLKKISESVTNFLSVTFNNQGAVASINNQFGPVWVGGYNALGHLNRVTNGASFQFGTDKLGRLLTTAYRDGSSWITNQTWGYSAGFFKPTSYKNGVGDITHLGYDSFERVTSIIQTNLSTNIFGYNAFGQLASMTSPIGGKTGWIYDSEGRLSQKTNDSGITVMAYYYYPNGWVSNRVDGVANSVKYTYDRVGNLKTNTYATRTELFTYDDLNRLSGMTDAIGTHVFTYENGFPKTEDGPWASDTVVSYFSNLRRSRLTSQTLYGTREILYGYDEGGRLNKVTSPAGTFGYEYAGGLLGTLSGLPGRLALPGGGLITNSFDHPLRFLTKAEMRSPAGNQTVANAYLYDLSGLVKTNFHSDSTKTLYAYHAHGALRSSRGYSTNDALLSEHDLGYNYDSAGNLIARTNVALLQSFTTNKLNQIASIQSTGTIVVAGAASPNASSVTVNSVSATLNADKTFYRASVPISDAVFSAVASNGSVSATDNVTNVWGASIIPTYDGYGNLKTFGNRIFSYDEENRLSSIIVTNSSTDSKKVEFAYDGLGRKRTRKEFKWQSSTWLSGGSGETRYLYDRSVIIEERNSNNQTLVQYTRGIGINGIGDLLSRSDAGAHSYYFSDRGNVVCLTDGAGNLKASYRYDPFGRVIESSGSLAEANRIQFSGREIDSVTGLSDFGGRFYDPSLQRFINPDPAREAGGLNLYAFANNSPSNYIDPTGENPAAIAGAIIGGAFGAASAYVNGDSPSAIAAAGAKGAAFGALAGFTGGAYGSAAFNALKALGARPLFAAIGAGMAGGFTGDLTLQAAELATGQRCKFRPEELLFSTALGGGLGGVGASIPRSFFGKYMSSKAGKIGDTTYDVTWGPTGNRFLDAIGVKNAKISNLKVWVDDTLQGADFINTSAHESLHVAIATKYPNFAASGGNTPYVGAFPLYAEEVAAYAFGAIKSGQYALVPFAPISAFGSLSAGQAISVVGTGAGFGGLWYFNTD